MKTLVLCRHAKSDWPDGVRDMDRPLKARGQKDASQLGKLLREHNFSPDLICSSPANRALSTAEIVSQKLGYEGSIQIDRSLYFEGESGLFGFISELPSIHDTVMIFGHNPTMEQAVARLAEMESMYDMPTAGMACFETNAHSWDQIIEATMRLRWLLVPRLARR